MTSLLLDTNGLHGRLLTGAVNPASLILCIHGGGCNGRYFDLPSFSFAREALSAGHAVLAIDRPGHGLSAAVDTSKPVQSAADTLPDLLAQALDAMDLNDLPLALFGHSIGGAVAMHFAATSPPNLACLVTSGIGHQPTPAAMAWHKSLNPNAPIQLPHEFFFGAEGSFDWRAPIAIRKSADVWLKADIDEVLIDWPTQFTSVASLITAPALCILGEHERIWRNGDADVTEISQGFTLTQGCVEIVSDGGHLNEVHKNWRLHASRIIAFIDNNLTARL